MSADSDIGPNFELLLVLVKLCPWKQINMYIKSPNPSHNSYSSFSLKHSPAKILITFFSPKIDFPRSPTPESLIKISTFF